MKSTDLKHHFLIAMPVLKDSIFAKSVIYVYEHDEKGAMGLVINKPMQVTLGNVLQHLDIEVSSDEIASTPVIMGGPVGQEQGFVIHDNFLSISDEEPDSNEITISASKDILKSIAEGNGPRHYIVTLGYSGWEPDQLEQEIARNDWLVVPFDAKIMFITPTDKRWQEAAKLIGVDINQLTNQVGHG